MSKWKNDAIEKVAYSLEEKDKQAAYRARAEVRESNVFLEPKFPSEDQYRLMAEELLDKEILAMALERILGGPFGHG